MGETTAIEWADATFNPWWGCTKVSPACDHCYAESTAKRYGHNIWGKGSARRFFGDTHWNEPRKWNRKAEKAGVPLRVFCASMADVFESHPELPPHRERLWDLIGETPWLRWMLLTKRPENARRMVPWGDDWPSNVWLGTTVEDQQRANLRIPRLLAVPAKTRFLSMEPLLGPVDLGIADHRGHERDDLGGWNYICLDCSTEDEDVRWFVYEERTPIDWVIVGGESGGGARPSHPDWFRSLRDQCVAGGVAFHFKQWGAWLPLDGHREHMDLPPKNRTWEKVGGDLKDGGAVVVRVGKKAAGRVFDGRTWDELPWQGEAMCERSRTAGIVRKTVKELRDLHLENRSWWDVGK